MAQLGWLLIMVKTIINEFSENTYLVNKGNEVFVIDPGAHFKEIKTIIDENNYILKGVLLTHGHFDHIFSLNDMIQEYNPEIYIHKDERDFLFSASLNLSSMINKQFKINSKDKINVIEDGFKITLGRDDIIVIHTPGHTRGSVCYLYKKYLFSGDTLFKGTVGRTDLPTGNKVTLERSLQKLISKCKDNTVVYPGHGDITTILNEKYENEYIKN